ncbi:hypothetical protein M3175_12370 [Robertmurraya korlensis]|nr:hypothetical protein [Robertmurraya korlensis]
MGAAVQGINLKDLKIYVNQTVELSIQDYSGDEQAAPFIKKSLVKVGLCPEETHVRIYFDDRNFFAIPRSSQVTESEKEWVAFDEASKLYYVIRKV